MGAVVRVMRDDRADEVGVESASPCETPIFVANSTRACLPPSFSSTKSGSIFETHQFPIHSPSVTVTVSLPDERNAIRIRRPKAVPVRNIFEAELAARGFGSELLSTNCRVRVALPSARGALASAPPHGPSAINAVSDRLDPSAA